jgi:hypothetical protein
MMKKIILTFILALSALFVEAQFGNTFIAPGTNVGTRQTNDGGYWPKLLFQPPTFGDTTAANNGKTNFYAGSVIFTTADGNFWYRTANATRWVLFTPQFNVCAGLISGGIVTLNTGLIMNVTAATYCINNTTYNSPATTLTLATADPSLPRIDRIVGDVTGNAVVITGTPAANPVAPFVNPVTQVAFTSILISAGATTPSNINRYIIYNENTPPDWVGSSNLSAGAVNFASTIFPYIGTIDAAVDSATVGSIFFTSSDTIDLQDENVLQMFIRLNRAYPTNSSISVAFRLGTTVVSNYATLNPSNGFTKSVSGSYQNISIPFSQFQFIGGTLVDGLEVRLTGASNSFYLDYVQLQNSVIPNQDDQFIAKYRRDTTPTVKQWGDSMIFFNNAFASPVLSLGPPSVPLVFQVNTRDTIAGASIRGEFDIYTQGRRGNSTPNFDLIVKSKNSGISGLIVNTAGTVTTGNGLIFDDVSRISAAGTLVYRSNSLTAKNRFVNFGGALSTNGYIAKFESGSATSGAGAKVIQSTGDANLPVFDVYTAGTVASGTNAPSLKAQMDIVSVGKGVIFPRMNTAQRDGIPKRVATVTITNGGAGMTSAPTITATTTGLPARFTATISGGVLTAITIDYGGTNYTAGGSLIIDTTGTNATVLPVATYTATTDAIPTALMIYNTDSLCYQSYNGSSWVNMREGSGGSPGSNENFANTDLTATGDRNHNWDNHSFFFHDASIIALWSVDGTGDKQAKLDLNPMSASGISTASPNGTTGVNFNDTLTTLLATSLVKNNFIYVSPTLTHLTVVPGDTSYVEIDNMPIRSNPTYGITMRNDTLYRTPYIPDTLLTQIYPLQSAVVGATIEQSISQGFLDSVRNGGTEYTYSIDLRAADYDIEGPGVYRITHGDNTESFNIHFPDATSFEGRWITIINNDTEDQFKGKYQGANLPFKNGAATNWAEILYGEMHRYVAIGGSWRGGKLTE